MDPMARLFSPAGGHRPRMRQQGDDLGPIPTPDRHHQSAELGRASRSLSPSQTTRRPTWRARPSEELDCLLQTRDEDQGSPGSRDSAGAQTGCAAWRARVRNVACVGFCKTPLRGLPGPPSEAADLPDTRCLTAWTFNPGAWAGKSHHRLWATPDNARQPEWASSHQLQRAALLAWKRQSVSKLHPPAVTLDFRFGSIHSVSWKHPSSGWDHDKEYDLWSGCLPTASGFDDLGFSHHPDDLLHCTLASWRGVLPPVFQHTWPSRSSLTTWTSPGGAGQGGILSGGAGKGGIGFLPRLFGKRR